MNMLERIFSSVEYRWRVQQAKSYGVFWLLVSVVIMVIMFSRGTSFVASLLTGAIVSAVFGIAFVFMILKSLMKNKMLVKNYDRFDTYSVLLDTPVASKTYRRFSSFVLRFDDKNGSQVICQTNPIFGLSDTELFPLAEYRDQYVDVLYDPKSNKVYVIGITEEE